MGIPSRSVEERINIYVTARDIELIEKLGEGKDGVVYSTNAATAIKAFERSDAFQREVLCYERFAERSVRKILEHAIPRMIRADSTLLVIEMNIVSPPFILDFASAYLDYPPDFPAEVLQQWEEDKIELFGANWPRVKMLMEMVENACDVYLFDVHPGNITFAGQA